MTTLHFLFEPLQDWAAFVCWQSFLLLGLPVVLERFFRRSPWQAHLLLTLGIFASVLGPAVSLLVFRYSGGVVSPDSLFALEKQAAGPALLLGPTILGGGILFSLVLLHGIISARRLMFHAKPFPDRESQEALLEGSRMMRNVSLPVLFTSPSVKSPTVWSWGLHPAVLLPESLCETLTHEERDGIFLHEIAHITRGDHWAGFLSRLCGVVLFWNPLYWLALKLADLSADRACDLLVLSQEKISPEIYGETLLRLAAGEKHRPALQYLSRKEQLMKRIDTILDFEENQRRFSVARTPSRILGITAMALCLVASLAFCQEKKTEKITTETKSEKKVDEKPAYEKAADALIERFNRNDFSDAAFTQAMKDGNASDIARSLWDDFTKQFGPFIRSKVVKTESLLEFKRVHERCEFKNGSAVLMVVVDKNDLIAGLFVLSVDKKKAAPKVDSYRVDKSLAEFPDKNDFSTPETAYAAYERTLCVQNEKDFAKNLYKISVPEIKRDATKPLEADWAKVLLAAKILSVCRCDDRAIVVAELEGENVRKPFNVRWFRKIDDRWLNAGNDRVDSEDDAKNLFEKFVGRRAKENPADNADAEKIDSQARSSIWLLDQEAQDRPPHIELWDGKTNMMNMVLAMRFGGKKWLELSKEQQKTLGFLGKQQELGAEWFRKMRDEQNAELIEAEEAVKALIPSDDPFFKKATEEQKKVYIEAASKVFLLFERYVQNEVTETLTPEQLSKLRSLEFTALPGIGEPTPHMFDSLGLSEEQRKKVEAIKREFEPEFLKLLDEQMELRREHLVLYTQGKNSEADRKDYNVRYKEQETRRIEFAERLKERLENDVLTEEQRVKAKKLADEIPGSLKQLFFKAGQSSEKPAPNVVRFEPPLEAKDVDHESVTEIRVTFDRDMDTGGYSWCGGGDDFPGAADKTPCWIGKRTCVLPAKLEPGKTYRLSINAPSFKNFRSEGGVPVEPVPYSFTTQTGKTEK